MKMGMYGADVAHLRALASHFEHSAQQLDAQRTRLGAAVQGSPWAGPNADRFRGEWHAEHGPRLATAARTLREGAATLRRNADQQEQASAVSGGASGGPWVSASVGSSLSAALGASGAHTPANIVAGLANRAFGAAEGFVKGAFGAAEGLMHAVQDEKILGVASAWDASMALTKGAKMIGIEMPFMGKADNAMELFSIADRVRQGHLNVFETADMASTVLRMVPAKVGELGALAIDATSYAAQQATQTDFSAATFASNASFIANHPLDALQGVGDGLLKFGKEFALPELQKAKDIPFLGAAMDATSYAVQQGAKADLSPGTRAMVADYVVQHPAETLQTVGESVLTVGKEALNWNWFK
ncbi:hypothetical protein SPF06_16820 [Sinomonas sp. JGH33]|uniref:WXG100 family type VII secretion target n=1 Tax=Sinomonas terricola TaxID=3110330 RepID=A0ABU5T9Q1_9MICC|nr:hypothetical protein [Sinomonas sp. JGH33]MEA5456399.1 hypothetical protein [Sinomonas sp. JGH33]